MNVEYFYDEIEIIESLIENCGIMPDLLKVDNLSSATNFLIFIEEKVDKYVQKAMDILYSGDNCAFYENLIQSNIKMAIKNL